MLRIGSTQYGGRAYFATHPIKSHTAILCDSPIIASIFDDFKKEVCVFCFAYHHGSTLKVRVGESSRACSEACRVKFTDMHGSDEVIKMYDLIQRRKKTLGDEVYYDLLRFCVAALPLKDKVNEHHFAALLDLQDDHPALSSIERDSATGIIAAMTKVAAPIGTNFADLVHTVMGRSKCNSFGIWQQENERSFPESEMFGYCLYAKASYFNHSCRPNVNKQRIGRDLAFTTSCDVEEGAELTINYLGDREYADTLERKAALRNWGFECVCPACVTEIH